MFIVTSYSTSPAPFGRAEMILNDHLDLLFPSSERRSLGNPTNSYKHATPNGVGRYFRLNDRTLEHCAVLFALDLICIERILT